MTLISTLPDPYKDPSSILRGAAYRNDNKRRAVSWLLRNVNLSRVVQTQKTTDLQSLPPCANRFSRSFMSRRTLVQFSDALSGSLSILDLASSGHLVGDDYKDLYPWYSFGICFKQNFSIQDFLRRFSIRLRLRLLSSDLSSSREGMATESFHFMAMQLLWANAERYRSMIEPT